MKQHLTEDDRGRVSQGIRHAKLVDATRKLARIIKHSDPLPTVKAARTRLERNFAAWLKHHGGEAFNSPWSEDHRKVLAKIDAAIHGGGLFALAMPRGGGKTTILKWATLYVLLTGCRKYVVIVAATAEMAQNIIEFCRQQLQESDTLHEHYPHITTYARATEGKAIKAKYQLRADGKTSGIQWSKNTLVLPEVLGPSGGDYPSNSAILEGHGLTGAIRGKWKDTKTGKVLRPDFVILDDPQTREALCVDTLIPTPDGFKRMGDLAIGDLVFGEKGNTVRVIGTSDIMLSRECVTVRFDDGAEVVCDTSHLWTTSTALQRTNERRKVKHPDPRFSMRPQCQAKAFSSVRTTSDLAATLTTEGGRNNHSIPLIDRIDYPSRSLCVEPYTMGAWLGDGSTNGARITGIDKEIFDRIQRDGYALGAVTKDSRSGCPTIGIKGLASKLKSAGVFGNKHIPDAYLCSSHNQRLDLLRGLMDTDGCASSPHAGKGIRCSFSNTNSRLITGVATLCHSLGIKARISKRNDGKAKRFPNGKVYQVAPSWTVSFITHLEVFHLPRKLQRLPIKTKPNTRRRYIAAIIPHRTVPVRCIRVDSSSGLFLCSDRYVATHNSAESVSQCDARERIITGDVLGLAGPKKKITAVMPCTIIRKGDLADRFLNHQQHPEWQGETCRLVNKWPTAQDTLWVQYREIYRDETSEGRGFSKATEFYQSKRDAMDAGAEISWKHRVRDGEVSAIQTAENLLIETGEQFWAEYQNDPRDLIASQYELTAEMVVAHTVTLPRLHLPQNATVFVGHCDINRSGLHWCLSSFDQAMTGHAVAYGKWPQQGDLWPENATEQVRQQAIYAGLKGLSDTLARTIFVGPVRLGLLLIDLGYERDVVHRFCNQARYPFRVLPSGGRAAHKYYVRKVNLVGRPFEGCHVEKATSGAGHYMVFNADQWRETAQRAFLSETGAPGGYTLHAVEDPRQHRDFANQIVAEKLHAKGLNSQGEMRWEWRHAPGNAWDWGDALTGCWVAAAASGLSASGTPILRAIRKETRKPRVQIGAKL